MWPSPQEKADLVTFTEEIFIGKLHFLCSEGYYRLFTLSMLYIGNAVVGFKKRRR